MGLGTVKCVIDVGGHAALIDVNEEKGNDRAEQLGEWETFIQTDVTKESAVKSAVQQANELMNGIMLKVNCVGIVKVGRTLG